MSGTQGLDALAALCGSTSAVPTSSSSKDSAPAESGVPRPNSAAGSNQRHRALLPEVHHSSIALQQHPQQLQQLPSSGAPAPVNAANYAIYAQQVQQAQQQAQAARAAQQAAAAQQMASLPPSVLQAYLAAAGMSLAAPGAAAAPSPLANFANLGAFAGHAVATPGGAMHQQQNAAHHAQAMAAQILAAQQHFQNSLGQQQQVQAAAAPSVAGMTPANAVGFWTAAASLGAGPASVPSAQLQQQSQTIASSPTPQVPVHIASPVKKAPVAPQSPAMIAMPPPQKAARAASPQSTKGAMSSSSVAQAQENLSRPTPSAAAVSTTSSVSSAMERLQHTPKTVISEWEDKKQCKRAANRLSAHLSRKRKKMFIEDLKDENSELRRKEQILRSIPDLIVVFDSSGIMSFVSASVTRFLNYDSHELENSSFWDRITDDSVRMIKAAFMDALAVKRSPHEDSTPLSNGDSMTVQLVGRDGKRDEGKLVSLKGVVHFAGDSPECVCSIRPDDCVRGAAIANESKSSDKTSSSLKVRRLAAAAGVPSHQISDVDSEKS